jgi:hypothetical protein
MLLCGELAAGTNTLSVVAAKSLSVPSKSTAHQRRALANHFDGVLSWSRLFTACMDRLNFFGLGNRELQVSDRTSLTHPLSKYAPVMASRSLCWKKQMISIRA